jgi:hypothetical protein
MTKPTKIEIRKGNIRIAKFLGYEYIPHNNPNKEDKRKAGWWKKGLSQTMQMLTQFQMHYSPAFIANDHNDLRFHSSWNRLMHVVGVIEKVGETEDMFGTRTEIDTDHIRIGNIIIDLKLYSEYKDLTKHEATWLAVVKYIEANDKTTD